jgi:GntR family transcriptional regulator, transcriptional repressor for pyruvate dehydrogenase complex
MQMEASPPTLIVRPARRKSLPEEITEQLLELIAAETAEEPRLPSERLLSEQLGVSRASLREALSALNELGVLDTRGKTKYARTARARAALVARVASKEPEQELILDPLEVRRMLEPEVAARAAERLSERDLRELERWLHLMEEAASRGERFIEYDSAFHVSIARATRNHTLIQLVAALTDVLREGRERSFEPPEAAKRALDDHRLILGALTARDSGKARRAMRTHLRHVEELVRLSLRDRPPETGA